jgi:hypothetical protein
MMGATAQNEIQQGHVGKEAASLIVRVELERVTAGGMGI